ncbi:unnamed protein product [Prorocentrum cordatum]|uniref:Reverse transcriptase domain-containing protein n=1 Tax=Prorocentrum cordatum TaxID=2364126 RepID=A0ABN9W8M1_9DINO|nr:unnamed protein product [Polarella glacialis]
MGGRLAEQVDAWPPARSQQGAGPGRPAAKAAALEALRSESLRWGKRRLAEPLLCRKRVGVPEWLTEHSAQGPSLAPAGAAAGVASSSSDAFNSKDTPRAWAAEWDSSETQLQGLFPPTSQVWTDLPTARGWNKLECRQCVQKRARSTLWSGRKSWPALGLPPVAPLVPQLQAAGGAADSGPAARRAFAGSPTREDSTTGAVCFRPLEAGRIGMRGKRALRRAVRLALVVGAAWYRARNDVTCFKERTVRLWSFNAESLRRIGRLEELLELAKAENVAIFAMQGTQMDLGMSWQSCGYSVHSHPRSGVGHRDGCLIAISARHFKPGEIRCEHSWLPGRLQGIRIRSLGHSRYERDLYILNGYAPTNDPGRPPNGVDAGAFREAHFSRQVQEGIEAMSLQEYWSDVCGSGKRFADPSEYFNAMEGVIIEAASQDYIDLPQPRGASTGPVFSEATMRLIKIKHHWQYQLAALSPGSRWLTLFFHQKFLEASKICTKAIRSEKRQRMAHLAAFAERSAGENNLRRLFSTVRRLAPKPPAPIMTVNDPQTGLPCFDSERDNQVRVASICSLCNGTAMALHELPVRARDMGRDDDRIGPYDLADIKQGIRNLPNFKGDGKSAMNDYRTISLINHIGKVFARVTALDAMRDISHRISPTQFGAMPGRGTRDAISVAMEVITRHQHAHRVRVRGRTTDPPPMLLVILTDLEKAFDIIARQSIWDSLESLQLRPDARETLEELHDGMCYLYRDVRTRPPCSRIHVQRGVRQGGVESPGLFVAAYDKLVAEVAERQRENEFPGIFVYFDPSLKKIRTSDPLLNDSCECLDVTHLKFLDDLLTLGEVNHFDEAPQLLDLVNGEISFGGMKVNANKTELLLIPSGTGSKRRQKSINSHSTGIVTWQDDEALAVHPQPTVKYLGVRMAASGSYQTEITHRLQSANQAHSRLLRRAFKGGFSPKMKIRLWKALVRSVGLYALEVAVMSKRELLRLESWQVRKLRGLLHSPAHINKLTNREIRRKARVPTVESTLQHRRLKWWRRVLWPVFRGPTPDLYDATLAVRAVIFGRFSFEPPGPREPHGLLAVLKGDLRQLWNTVEAHEQLEARRLFLLHGDLPDLAEPWLKQIHNLSLQHLLLSLPVMFQPIAEVQVAASQKRAAAPNPEDKGEGNDIVGPLAKALARLALQHEAKEKASEQGSQFLGNPLGKRPDALARAVVFRIMEAVLLKRQQVTEAVSQGAEPEAAQAALEALLQMGKLAQNTEAKFVATRCFRIQVSRNEGDSNEEGETRWIFAVNHYPGFKAALNTLRTNGALTAAGIVLQYDIATRSKAAKLVETLAFRSGSGSASGGKKKQSCMARVAAGTHNLLKGLPCTRARSLFAVERSSAETAGRAAWSFSSRRAAEKGDARKDSKKLYTRHRDSECSRIWVQSCRAREPDVPRAGEPEDSVPREGGQSSGPGFGPIHFDPGSVFYNTQAASLTFSWPSRHQTRDDVQGDGDAAGPDGNPGSQQAGEGEKSFLFNSRRMAHQDVVVGATATERAARRSGEAGEALVPARAAQPRDQLGPRRARQPPVSSVLASRARVREGAGASATRRSAVAAEAADDSSTALDFEQWGLDDDYMASLLTAMEERSLAQVESIRLSENRLTSVGAERLHAVSPALVRLKSLDLAHNRLGEAGGMTIARLVRSTPNKSLAELELAGNVIGDRACAELCDALGVPALSARAHAPGPRRQRAGRGGRHRGVLGAARGTTAEAAPEPGLALEPPAQRRSDRVLGVYENNCTVGGQLLRLDLSWNMLGEDANGAATRTAKVLSSLFADGKVMFHLDLSYNCFVSSDCLILAEGLKNNHTLFGIHMSGNEATVDDQGFIVPRPGALARSSSAAEGKMALPRGDLGGPLPRLAARCGDHGDTLLQNTINDLVRSVPPTFEILAKVNSPQRRRLGPRECTSWASVERDVGCCWLCHNWVEQEVSYIPGWSGPEGTPDEVVSVYAFFGIDSFATPTALSVTEEPFSKRLFADWADRSSTMKPQTSVKRTASGRVCRWAAKRMLPPTAHQLEVVFQVNGKFVVANDMPKRDLANPKTLTLARSRVQTEGEPAGAGALSAGLASEAAVAAIRRGSRVPETGLVCAVNLVTPAYAALKNFQYGIGNLMLFLDPILTLEH